MVRRDLSQGHLCGQGGQTEVGTTLIAGDALWYKDAVIYEVPVRSFCDSNGDGVGDFPGLTEKLDYISDLGVDCIWLLPFYDSPRRDDGYDIADYYRIHPEYGAVDDFKAFLDSAHDRGIKVIADLVLNHTSDQHRWFQEARRSPNSPFRDYYVWSENPEKYSGVRVIFTDTEISNWTWDPLAKAYYWHRFFSHQPDLNFDNQFVREAMKDVVRYWLAMGLDGFRCDAVPYLYEREGTNCENLAETHVYLRELRKLVDEEFPGRILLAEANQWPADVRAYFGDGNEMHMAFHFPIMPRLFMALRREDYRPIIEIVTDTPAIPASCQWGMFLRNHDELTLEMVTDEDREYMYQEFAQDSRMRLNVGIRRRLAPLVENGRRQFELLHSILLSMPGSPILYYGDEIGMGDNIYLGDRHGVRTPMQWTGDRNAGFSKADPSRLATPLIMDPVYGYQALNVESQERTPTSRLAWMKRLIAVRKRYSAFGRGTIEFVCPTNHKVLAYVRRHEEQLILAVLNLSRFVQCADIDLSQFQGYTPVELIGETEFPAITSQPYFFTLGPHSFYWFRLEATNL